MKKLLGKLFRLIFSDYFHDIASYKDYSHDYYLNKARKEGFVIIPKEKNFIDNLTICESNICGSKGNKGTNEVYGNFNLIKEDIDYKISYVPIYKFIVEKDNKGKTKRVRVLDRYVYRYEHAHKEDCFKNKELLNKFYTKDAL